MLAAAGTAGTCCAKLAVFVQLWTLSHPPAGAYKPAPAVPSAAEATSRGGREKISAPPPPLLMLTLLIMLMLLLLTIVILELLLLLVLLLLLLLLPPAAGR